MSIDRGSSRFCQVVEAETFIKQAGVYPRSYPNRVIIPFPPVGDRADLATHRNLIDLNTVVQCPWIVYTDLNGLFCKGLEEAHLSR